MSQKQLRGLKLHRLVEGYTCTAVVLVFFCHTHTQEHSVWTDSLLPVGSRGKWTSCVHTLPCHSSAVRLASGSCCTHNPPPHRPGYSDTPPPCCAGPPHMALNTGGQRRVRGGERSMWFYDDKCCCFWWCVCVCVCVFSPSSTQIGRPIGCIFSADRSTWSPADQPPRRALVPR